MNTRVLLLLVAPCCLLNKWELYNFICSSAEEVVRAWAEAWWLSRSYQLLLQIFLFFTPLFFFHFHYTQNCTWPCCKAAFLSSFSYCTLYFVICCGQCIFQLLLFFISPNTWITHDVHAFTSCLLFSLFKWVDYLVVQWDTLENIQTFSTQTLPDFISTRAHQKWLDCWL